MKNKKTFVICIAVLLLLVIVAYLIGTRLCKRDLREANIEQYELTQEQKDLILQQCIEGKELYYTEYLDSKWFISGEFFEVEKTDQAIYVYGYLAELMYAPFKDKAYLLSGSNIPVKLTVEPETMKLIRTEIPEDGTTYDSSLRELFTEDAYRKCVQFDATGLNQGAAKQAEKEWNVTVDDNYQLHIEDDGKYEIDVIDNDGSDGSAFEYHVEEQGTLERR